MNIIKISFLCILLFFNIFVSEATAESRDIMETDGVEWIDSSESFRVGFVVGFLSGISVAESEFSYPSYLYDFEKLLKEDLDSKSWGIAYKGKQLKEEIDKSREKIVINEITTGQITDGVNAFYKDFSNRRIKIVDAIYVVKMQIKGEAPVVINAQIRFLKMQPISMDQFKRSYIRQLEFEKKRGKRLPTYEEIKNGDFSKEDLLISGTFIDENNKMHTLFRYGKYK